MTDWAVNEEITAANLNDRKGFKNRVRVNLGGSNQKVTASAEVRVRFNSETYDVNSEFDSSEKAGTADATEALKLHDAHGGFVAGDVGKWVWNTTDDTYAIITGFVDSGELDLDTNIMANGETYIIYNSLFTCKDAGAYRIYACVNCSNPIDQKTYVVKIFKNNGVNPAAMTLLTAAGVEGLSVTICDEVVLAVNDYIDIRFYSSSGSVSNIADNSFTTYLIIRRVY